MHPRLEYRFGKSCINSQWFFFSLVAERWLWLTDGDPLCWCWLLDGAVRWAVVALCSVPPSSGSGPFISDSPSGSSSPFYSKIQVKTPSQPPVKTRWYLRGGGGTDLVSTYVFVPNSGTLQIWNLHPNFTVFHLEGREGVFWDCSDLKSTSNSTTSHWSSQISQNFHFLDDGYYGTLQIWSFYPISQLLFGGVVLCPTQTRKPHHLWNFLVSGVGGGGGAGIWVVFCGQNRIWTKISSTPARLVHHSRVSHTTYVETNNINCGHETLLTTSKTPSQYRKTMEHKSYTKNLLRLLILTIVVLYIFIST